MTVARRTPPALMPPLGDDDSDAAASTASRVRGFVLTSDPTGAHVSEPTRTPSSSTPVGSTRIQLTRPNGQARASATPSRFRSTAPVQASTPFLEIELPPNQDKLELRVGVTPSIDDAAIAAAPWDDGLLFTLDIGYLEMRGRLGVVLHERRLTLFSCEDVRTGFQTAEVT